MTKAGKLIIAIVALSAVVIGGAIDYAITGFLYPSEQCILTAAAFSLGACGAALVDLSFPRK